MPEKDKSKYHIYIHFPYCLYKCHYCDFNSYATNRSDIPLRDYTEALLQEISYRKTLIQSGEWTLKPNSNIESIFFGGGTPSLMRPQDIEKIIGELGELFRFSEGIEITLEANPGTLSSQKLVDFSQAGINRLSIGIQSFNDKYLHQFGRIHSGEEAFLLLKTALKSPIRRVSADLIFGYPGQSLSEWQADLSQIMSTGLKHLSCYVLTNEEKTLYSSKLARGELEEQKSEIVKAMLDLTYDQTKKNGLHLYEISNFASPGEESRHNLGYWQYHSFMGLGAGAWGQYFFEKTIQDEDEQKGFVVRDLNEKSPQMYMDGVKNKSFFVREKITRAVAMGEYLMMGLRLSRGSFFKDFKECFGLDLMSVYQKEIELAVSDGLLEIDHESIKPSSKGIIFNNKLVSLFIR